MSFRSSLILAAMPIALAGCEFLTGVQIDQQYRLVGPTEPFTEEYRGQTYHVRGTRYELIDGSDTFEIWHVIVNGQRYRCRNVDVGCLDVIERAVQEQQSGNNNNY